MNRWSLALAVAMMSLGCFAPVSYQGGWFAPRADFGRTVLVFHEDESGDAAAVTGLRGAVAGALASRARVRDLRVVDEDAAIPPGFDTVASFEVRFEGGEVSADLLPWPAITVRRELRYRLTLREVETGRVLGDVDRTLVRHGPGALSPWKAGWIAADLGALVDEVVARRPPAQGASSAPRSYTRT